MKPIVYQHTCGLWVCEGVDVVHRPIVRYCSGATALEAFEKWAGASGYRTESAASLQEAWNMELARRSDRQELLAERLLHVENLHAIQKAKYRNDCALEEERERQRQEKRRLAREAAAKRVLETKVWPDPPMAFPSPRPLRAAEKDRGKRSVRRGRYPIKNITRLDDLFFGPVEPYTVLVEGNGIRNFDEDLDWLERVYH